MHRMTFTGRVVASAAVLVLAAAEAPAQPQPNGNVSLLINTNPLAASATTYPVQASAYQGSFLDVLITTNNPVAPFILLYGNTGPSVPVTGYGFVDLALSPLPAVILNGVVPTTIFDYLAVTDIVGFWEFVGVVSPSAPTGTKGWQVIGADSASPSGYTLSAANWINTQSSFAVETATFNDPGDETAILHRFWNMTFPFYGATYAECVISTNGWVSFGTYPIGAAAFSGLQADFLASSPRIGVFFTDFCMNSLAGCGGVIPGGPISIVTQETPGGLTINWNNASEYLQANSNTFTCTLQSTGAFTTTWTTMGAASLPAIVGVTPGLNTSAAAPVVFAAGGVITPTAGGAGQALYQAMTPPYANPFNLGLTATWTPGGSNDFTVQ